MNGIMGPRQHYLEFIGPAGRLPESRLFGDQQPGQVVYLRVVVRNREGKSDESPIEQDGAKRDLEDAFGNNRILRFAEF
jgi:hypothetical protein